MFTGRIGENIIMSDRPIVAVDGEQILFAFDNEEDATGFLLRSGSDTTTNRDTLNRQRLKGRG